MLSFYFAPHPLSIKQNCFNASLLYLLWLRKRQNQPSPFKLSLKKYTKPPNQKSFISSQALPILRISFFLQSFNSGQVSLTGGAGSRWKKKSSTAAVSDEFNEWHFCSIVLILDKGWVFVSVTVFVHFIYEGPTQTCHEESLTGSLLF